VKVEVASVDLSAWVDVLVSFSSSDKACGSVVNSWKFIQFMFWETIKDTITVIQT